MVKDHRVARLVDWLRAPRATEGQLRIRDHKEATASVTARDVRTLDEGRAITVRTDDGALHVVTPKNCRERGRRSLDRGHTTTIVLRDRHGDVTLRLRRR